MKKIIFIAMALILLVLVINRVDTSKSLNDNMYSVIGCMDYGYVYNINVPATMTFYVTANNSEDSNGFFKMNYASTNGSTVLHCGNSYLLIVSAEGYKDYTEIIPAQPTRTLVPQVHEINLERI